MSPADSSEYKLRRAFLPIYLPGFLFALAEGSIIPVIPSVAGSLGSSLGLSGLIAGLLTIGSLFGNIPAGAVVARFGERISMIASAVLAIFGGLLSGLASSLWAFALGIAFIGVAHAVFNLARQALLTTYVPLSHRSRALSTLGGAFRAGIFVGPLLTAGIVALWGDSQLAFYGLITVCIGIVLVLFLIADPTTLLGEPNAEFANRQARLQQSRDEASGKDSHRPPSTEGFVRVAHRNWRLLLKVGTPSAILSGLRSSRQIVLPMWAVSIGLADETTALVMGVAAAVDFSLFYVGGWLMDNYGRLVTTVPALTALSFGLILLVVSQNWGDPFVWFVISAIGLSLANGSSSGVLMTLGADLAPPANPVPFLGVWRTATETGQATIPVVISVLTSAFSLSVAAVSVGLLGLVGSGLFIKFLPPYDRKGR